MKTETIDKKIDGRDLVLLHVPAGYPRPDHKP
jgi:hypothetical protein